MVELSELTVRGEPWWTLAFESFGRGNREMNLEPFALQYIKMLPHGLIPTERASMAYPEWLNRLAGQRPNTDRTSRSLSYQPESHGMRPDAA